jgi:hypothetical protein
MSLEKEITSSCQVQAFLANVCLVYSPSVHSSTLSLLTLMVPLVFTLLSTRNFAQETRRWTEPCRPYLCLAGTRARRMLSSKETETQRMTFHGARTVSVQAPMDDHALGKEAAGNSALVPESLLFSMPWSCGMTNLGGFTFTTGWTSRRKRCC